MILTGYYRHYKGGEYEVIGTAKHSETLELMVVYKALKDGSLWTRPATMFVEMVEVNGEKVPRFQEIDGPIVVFTEEDFKPRWVTQDPTGLSNQAYLDWMKRHPGVHTFYGVGRHDYLEQAEAYYENGFVYYSWIGRNYRRVSEYEFLEDTLPGNGGVVITCNGVRKKKNELRRW